MSQSLTATIKDSILFVNFSHPKSANAFGLAEAERLQQILQTSLSDQIKGLLFYSAQPRNFCSGGDMVAYAQLDDVKDGLVINRKITQILDALTDLPVPKIAIVNGNCFGGGMELLACFDKILATPRSYFAFWQRRIGLSFGWGGYQRWQRRLSSQLLEQLFLETRPLCCYEALEQGLVDGVGKTFSMLQRQATQWIHQCQRWPQAPLKARVTLRDQGEQATFESLWGQSEHQRALQRFRRK